MKNFVKMLLLFWVFSFFSFTFSANYFFFYGNGCPHCFQAMTYLEDNWFYEDYTIENKEIYFDDDNLDLFIKFKNILKLDNAWVPLLVIQSWTDLSYEMGDKDIISYFDSKSSVKIVSENTELINTELERTEPEIIEPVNSDLENIELVYSETINSDLDQDANHENLKNDVSSVQIISENSWESLWTIKESIVDENIVPIENDSLIEEQDIEKGKYTNLKFLFVLIPAALSDSINPCAFAVILLLLTSILTAYKKKKKVILAGSLFTLAIFLSYLFMWMWLYSALASTQYTFLLKLCVGILWIIVGLANLKDFFWYGKWFTMEVPYSWKPKMQKLINDITSPIGAFLIGFVISLFLLPCSSGPYIVIIWLLREQGLDLWTYLFFIIYNFIFILPMFIITFLVWMGYKSAEQLAKIKKDNTKLIHLLVGLLMIGLWLYVLLSM